MKVLGAGLVGAGTPVVNQWINNLEPMLKTFIMLGQIGIAIVTIVYIYAKAKRIFKSLRDGDTKDKDE